MLDVSINVARTQIWSPQAIATSIYMHTNHLVYRTVLYSETDLSCRGDVRRYTSATSTRQRAVALAFQRNVETCIALSHIKNYLCWNPCISMSPAGPEFPCQMIFFSVEHFRSENIPGTHFIASKYAQTEHNMCIPKQGRAPRRLEK